MNDKIKSTKDTSLALSVFAFFLAWSIIFDNYSILAKFPDFSELNFINKIRLITCLIAIWTLIKPSSLLRFSLLVIFRLIIIFAQLQFVPNHLVLTIVLLLTILTCFLYLKFFSSNKFNKKNFYDFFAPYLRIELLILYFWAVVHKFNTGFLDPDISCATVEYFRIKSVLTFLPVSDLILNLNIYVTLAIEILIPLLLLFSRTRVPGLVLGICFHFVLGFQYTGFTILVLALYSLFISNDTYEKLDTRIRELCLRIKEKSKWFRWHKNTTLFNIFLQILLFFTILIIPILKFSKHSLYLAFIVIVGVTALYLIIGTKGLSSRQKVDIVPKGKLLFIFPLIVFLIGTLPHLGIKNIQVFAMFSNLRTEGGKTNHLFIPSSIQLSDNLEDLVSIKSSNWKWMDSMSQYIPTPHPMKGTSISMTPLYIKHMREKYKDFQVSFKYMIPFIHLQNIITWTAKKGVKNLGLVYERKGKIYYTNNAELEPDLSRASFFQLKFLYMRAVPDDDRGFCMW